MVSAMDLSIIIVNYNSGALTHSCIESLLMHELPKKTEIIVVDNASGDDSVPFLRSDFPEITVIANKENKGLAAAVNQGLEIGKGEFFLLLNPDIIAFPGAVIALIDYLKKNPKVGVAGGQLVSPNGKLQHSAFRFYTPMTILYRRTFLGRTKRGRESVMRFLMKDYDHSREHPAEWLMGSCLAMRREAVEEVGGMDEDFFLYFEDVDWCRRFWEKGWKVMYVPQARFSHFHQRSSRKKALLGVVTNWTAREHIRSAVKYFWKYRGKEMTGVFDDDGIAAPRDRSRGSQ